MLSGNEHVDKNGPGHDVGFGEDWRPIRDDFGPITDEPPLFAALDANSWQVQMPTEIREIFTWVARFAEVGVSPAQIISRLELAYYAHVNEVPSGKAEQSTSQA